MLTLRLLRWGAAFATTLVLIMVTKEVAGWIGIGLLRGVARLLVMSEQFHIVVKCSTPLVHLLDIELEEMERLQASCKSCNAME